MVEFVSTRGRVYSLAEVRPVVAARIRKRWGSLLAHYPGWRERVLAKLADGSAWARSRNGMIPGALARDLDSVVFDGAEPQS
jgi:hypothetical protein